MTISEVSLKFDISSDTLRYYERIGLIPPVNRNTSGIRDYCEDDLNWVEFIKCMRNAGLSIEALREYVELFNQGNSTIEKRKQLLITQKNKLKDKVDELNETIDRLDYKIDNYEKLMSDKKI